MKKTKKTLAILTAAAMALSAIPASYASDGTIVLPADVGENFDSDISHGDRWGTHAWNYESSYLEYVNSDGLFGRKAEPGDRSLKWGNGNQWVNFLYYIPGVQSEEYKNNPAPKGIPIETSFKFAVDTKANPTSLLGGNIYIQLNGNAGTAASVVIPHKQAAITAVNEKSLSKPKQLNNSDGSAQWHEIKFITLFNEGTSLGEGKGSEGTGSSVIYLDNEILGETREFAYSGISDGEYNFLKNFDNSTLWNLKIDNLTHYTGCDDLYIDDVNIHVIDYSSLDNAIKEAENACANNNYNNAQKKYLKKYIEKAKMTAAISNENLITQDAVNVGTSELLQAIKDANSGNIDDTTDYPSITENFNNNIQTDLDWGQSAPWLYESNFLTYESSNGLFGRKAEANDKCISWSNGNPWLNRLMFFPSRVKDMTMPYGTTIETSMKFAVKSNPKEDGSLSDSIDIGINGCTNSTPVIRVSIPHMQRKINFVGTSENGFTVDKKLDDEEGNPIWHELSLLTMFNEGESLGEGTGSVGTGRTAVYLDGELMGETMDFNYSGMSTLERGFAGPWDNSGIWDLYIKNMTHYSQPDSLYIDDLSIKAVNDRSTAFNVAINKADELIKNAVIGDELGQHKQSDADALKSAADKAKEVYTSNNLFTQSLVDDAYFGLTDAIEVFERSAVSEVIKLTRTGSVVKAEFTKISNESAAVDAKLAAAVYDSEGILLGIVTDSGNGQMIFDGETQETKTLSAQIDIAALTDAKTAQAFIWNSLSGMSPILPSATLELK